MCDERGAKKSSSSENAPRNASRTWRKQKSTHSNLTNKNEHAKWYRTKATAEMDSTQKHTTHALTSPEHVSGMRWESIRWKMRVSCKFRKKKRHGKANAKEYYTAECRWLICWNVVVDRDKYFIVRRYSSTTGFGLHSSLVKHDFSFLFFPLHRGRLVTHSLEVPPNGLSVLGWLRRWLSWRFLSPFRIAISAYSFHLDVVGWALIGYLIYLCERLSIFTVKIIRRRIQ